MKVWKRKNKILYVLVLSIFFSFFFISSVHAEVFIDDMGRKVYINKPPTRIISLAPSIAEILFYLGLGDRVVGVTNFCNYPPEATKKEKIGLLLDPDIEKIISLKPDMVFATTEGNRPQVVELLERFNIPVYILSPHSIEDILKDMVSIGKIADIKNDAYLKVKRLRDRISRIKNLAESKKPVKTLFLISLDPVISAGNGSFIDDIITLAGGINIVDPSLVAYPRINEEMVLLRQPEVIIGPPHVINALLSDNKWHNVRAVKSHKIYKINQDIISRPGPRIIDALEVIYSYLHGVDR